MTYLSAILKRLQKTVDCDLVDQLNYYYTTFLLVVFTIIVTAKQYVGYPIQCWVPAHFTEAMEQYTENYCFVQNTWWIPLSKSVPKSYTRREARQLTYYQWVPLILFFEAILFYAPYILWRILSSNSDIDVQHVVRLAGEIKLDVNLPHRKTSISSAAIHLDEIFMQRNYSKQQKKIEPNSIDIIKLSAKNFCVPQCLTCNKSSGYYLTVLYITTKVLYLINIVVQYFLMAYFLGTKQTTFGWELLQDLLRGRQWQKSGIFPRVTMCDFEVKVMGNLHRHTVQCVLMINMINEKIFLFLWFWYAFLFAITAINLLYWITLLLVPNFRYRFLKSKLKFDFDESKLVRSKYFRSDCIFIMKLIANYAGDSVLSEIFRKLMKTVNSRNVRNLTTNLKTKDSFDLPSSKIDLVGHSPVLDTVLMETDEHEITSFKENLSNNGDHRPPVNGLKLKLQEKATGVSSTADRKFKKHRIWIGGKGLAVRGRSRKEKMSHKIASDDDSEEEEISSTL